MNSFPKNPRNPVRQNVLLILVGGSAVLLVIVSFIFLMDKEKSLPAPQITAGEVQVLIPIAPIESGTELEPQLFRLEKRPAAQIGEGYLRDLEQIKGVYAGSYIAAGAPLNSAYVTTKRPINQIQANIPDGYRAVTLGVDATTSVEGWARPGAKVDVLLSSVVAAKPVIRVIVQNAKVLSAGMQANGEPQDAGQNVPATVTLLVTADEAGKIQLASSSGSLSLVLRGDEDAVESEDSLTVNIDTILGREDPPYPTSIVVQGQVKVGEKKYQVVDGKLKEVP